MHGSHPTTSPLPFPALASPLTIRCWLRAHYWNRQDSMPYNQTPRMFDRARPLSDGHGLIC